MVYFTITLFIIIIKYNVGKKNLLSLTAED